MARKQGQQAARANHVRNQPGDPFKAATGRVTFPSSGNVRELEALAPAFIEWYGRHQFSADIEEVLESLTHFFRYYPEFDGSRTITALEPAEVIAKLTTLMTHALLDGVMATYSLMRLLGFLRDSGRWSGSQESFQTVHGILEDILHSEVQVVIRHRPITDHATTGTAE
ncbi:hypothetical protein [Arthrobacter sp. Soil764]|uniref:hypothetical protein n=1 Tax=Arthrobacter sp. Soil764 TaxID=1736403 RepID=UPI000AF03848|nr:hypothetical protein [Arthrobacter sp. Soil764]